MKSNWIKSSCLFVFLTKKKKCQGLLEIQIICPIFEAFCELNKLVLLTIEDVWKYYLFKRQELKNEISGKDISSSEMSQNVYQEIKDI